MNSQPPSQVEKAQPHNSPAHQAATVSYACPFIASLVMVFSRCIASEAITQLLGNLIIVAGLSFGIVALFGLRKYGIRGILAPAIIGIIINGIMLILPWVLPSQGN